jgi:hypothetical protein
MLTFISGFLHWFRGLLSFYHQFYEQQDAEKLFFGQEIKRLKVSQKNLPSQ